MMGEEEDLSLYREINKLSLAAVEEKESVRRFVNLYLQNTEERGDLVHQQPVASPPTEEEKEEKRPPLLVGGLPVIRAARR